MTLWIILTIMTSGAAVIVSGPFLRRLDQHRAAAAAGDVEVYRDQLLEVEKDASAGLIDGDDAETARVEIKRRLLAADRAEQPVLARLSISEKNFAVIAVAGIVVLGSVGLYALNGSPELPSAPTYSQSARTSAPSVVDQLAAATGLQPSADQLPAQSRVPLGTVDEMLDRLVARLKQNPADPEGWRMLGWSYFSTERFAEAAAAYAKVIELVPDNAGFRSARGEALVRAADGLVTDDAKAAFTKALQLDPKDARARFFIGLTKEQSGARTQALDDWIAILNDADTSEPWYADLVQRADELATDIGVDLSARLRRPQVAGAGGTQGPLTQSQTPQTGGTNLRGPTTDDIRNAEAMAPSDRNAMIRGMVDRLASRLDQSPRDVEGWVKLIRSRKMLGEADAATAALHRALDIFKDAPLEQGRIAAAARELGVSP
jgi:cytochrome c-type biogenesis protein CcmH